eukprot:1617914-Rhodomonas_salina.1
MSTTTRSDRILRMLAAVVGIPRNSYNSARSKVVEIIAFRPAGGPSDRVTQVVRFYSGLVVSGFKFIATLTVPATGSLSPGSACELQVANLPTWFWTGAGKVAVRD